MFVNGYDFNTRALEFERVDLATCVPDDPDGLEEARASLSRCGQYVAGGGALHATLLLVCPVVEKSTATAEFQKADDAWGAELRTRFGRNACNVRYLPAGRGVAGSVLRRLFEARDTARIAFDAAWARP